MPRVAFITLGCKVNQYDSDAVASEFRRAGYEVVPPDEPADVFVVNTCTVTQTGDKKSRQLIRRAHTKNPDALIVAAGCYAQASPEELAELPGVRIVSGTSDRAGIVGAVDEALARRDLTNMRVGDIRGCREFEEIATEGSPERTRAYVKIEDGCENFCAYCKVAFVRGPVRSRRPEHILAELERLARRGFREVVLTGISLGSYGRDFGGHPDLADVVELAAGVDGIERVRLSSVDPTDVTDELIHVMACLPRVCPHLHVPLQSGDDGVLVKMNRRYTAREYERTVERARAAIPDLAVTTDIIVGFPGESDAAFEATMNLCRRVRFSRMHVFQYSPRKGTAAAGRTGQVPRSEKEQRSARLIQLGRDLSLQFHRRLVGRTVSVLVEQVGGDRSDCGGARSSDGYGLTPPALPAGHFEGLTPNYVRVLAYGAGDARAYAAADAPAVAATRAARTGTSGASAPNMAAGDIVNVRVTDAEEGFVRGRLE